jgi:hypothetical protein
MNRAAVARSGAKRTLPGRLETRFVLALTLPLLALAIIVNVPPIHALAWPRYVFNAAIWLTALAILLHDPQWRRQTDRSATAAESQIRRRRSLLPGRPRNDRTILAALGILAALSVFSFYDFGRFHGGGRFVHYHDLYHYYMGSKYFPEVGYEGLYAATHRALVENDPALSDAISLVKNLRTYDVENTRISMQRSDAVADLFSEPRWQQFKHDVRFFQAGIAPAEWQVLLVDHGFNATPFWTGVGSALSAHLPLNHATLLFLALLDPLLLAAALLLVWRTFDARTCLLVAIFLFANFFGVFDITGGAFLRQLWLAALIGFVCCYHRGWMIPAALLLAIAVLDRVFPIVFVLPPLVLLIVNVLRRRPERRSQVRFFVAFVGCLAGLAAVACTTTGGPRTWVEWYSKIKAHNSWFYTNQLSLRNLFIVNPAQSLRTISGGWDEGLWLREREALDAATRNTLLATRAALLGLLVAAIARRKEVLGSLALVAFAPLVLFYPADYYCVFLVIAVLCWRGNRPLALAIMALQALFSLVNVALSSGVRLELLHWIVSLSLVAAFVVFLLRELFDASRSAFPVRSRRPAMLLGGAAVILVAGIAADAHAARQDRLPIQLDLTPQNVSLARGLTPRLEQMAAWGNAWTRNDHLLCPAEAPGAQAVVRVPAAHTGTYRVTVAYSTGPPFGMVTLAINGQEPFAASNLYAPHLGVQKVVYEPVALRAGSNEFSFVASGKDSAAKDYCFAIDTITVDCPPPHGPEPGQQSRRAALDRAVAWLAAHPADCFDGGRRAICNEVAVLYALLSNPHLSASRSNYLAGLEQCVRRLNTQCGPRVRPDEYDALLAAAYMSQQFKLPFSTLDQLSAQLKPWVDALYGDRSVAQLLLAGMYFNRLYPAQAVACTPEQSVLYREYTERKLAQVLAGRVERTKSRAIATTVFALSQDICALTDFGRLPPPATGFLADKQFWAQLCEHGLRWTMQTGDLLTLARLAHMAGCLRVARDLPALPLALDFLVQHQQPDGSFGALTCDRPNPYRDGVLNAILALASSLQ